MQINSRVHIRNSRFQGNFKVNEWYIFAENEHWNPAVIHAEAFSVQHIYKQSGERVKSK